MMSTCILQAASDMGYSMASCNVGLYYENGVSVLTSYNKAKQYYELAIQQNPNNGYAYYMLGNMYANGNGVTTDYKVAAEYYKTGADLGDDTAMNAMGDMYYWGYGVNLDYKESVRYYECC